jgi:putative sulfotransferase
MLARRRVDCDVLLRNRLEPPEFLYPADEPRGQFSRESGVPALSMIAVPHLEDPGDELLADICAEATRWGRESIGVHYRRLFDWLRDRYGAERWIERSGGSLDFADSLAELFPDARFVHLYRDGVACVASMERHPVFRIIVLRMQMAMRFGLDPFETDERSPELVEGSLARFLPERFDADAFMGDAIPQWWFAALWTNQLVRGMPVLASLPPERVLHIRFEDLLSEPAEQIARFVSFVDGDADPVWAESAARLVARRPPPPRTELDPTALRIVERGERILRDAGL